MRLLYIAPRLHPNQIGIMNGWKENGDEVFFLARKIGNNEDHSIVKPDIITYSWISRLFISIYKIIKRNDAYAGNIDLLYGFPSGRKIYKYLKKIRPDIVILREKSLYSIVCNRQCNKLKISTLVYNQNPVMVVPEDLKRDALHKIVDGMLPEKRITPVWEKYDGKEKVKDKNAIFLPFVVSPKCMPEEKKYFYDNIINLIDVGKFEKRKNHILLLKVFKKIIEKHPDVRLQIVGNMNDDDSFARSELNKVNQFIKDNNLTKAVRVYVNVPHDEMDLKYRMSDIYVLPSTSEPAAVSHLEAMSYSIPAICSTGNATASYIQNGISGYIFIDNDEEDLYNKLDKALSDRKIIVEMGKNAYKNVCDNYQFKNYYNTFKKMICNYML